MGRTTLVVPSYNEADRFDPGPWRAFVATNADCDLLFVNDGSTDGTATVLDELAASVPDRIRALHLSENRGKAEAVRAGVLAAMEADDLAAVGFWDADLSTPLAAVRDFEAVLASRPDVLMVIGARVKLLGRTVERQTTRHYGGRVFATFASVMLGIPVYDTQCGAKLFRTGDHVSALFDEPFVTRWTFDVELLARLGAHLGSMDRVVEAVYELPLREWIHASGSNVSVLDFPRSFVELLRIRRTYRPGREPS